jgi:hypothetical protein
MALAPVQLGLVLFSLRGSPIQKKERQLWRAFPRLLVRSSPRRGLAKYRTSDTLYKEPLEDLIHASVDCRGGSATKLAMESIPQPSIAPQRNSTVFAAKREKRHNGFSWAIPEVVVDDNATVLADALVPGKAIEVSNGSFKNNQGTAGFVIKGNN